MGHLDQVRQNIRSTKKSRPNDKEVTEFDDDTNPNGETEPSNMALASVVELDAVPEGKSYSDLTGLCSADNDFPIRLWDRLIPQAEITLNLLRASRNNPTISAYEAINGVFDYNKTPLAPPGCKIIIHEKPSQHGSWDPHGVIGWYLGPAMEHYRCHRCYVIKTQSERISDTVEFFPCDSKTPILSTVDAAIAAVEALTTAINLPKQPTLLAPSLIALQQLSNALAPKDCDTDPSPRVRISPRVPAEEKIASRTRSAAACAETLFKAYYMANAVTHPVTGATMESRRLITDPVTKEAWLLSSANEFG
jgi:hypothetical protein